MYIQNVSVYSQILRLPFLYRTKCHWRSKNHEPHSLQPAQLLHRTGLQLVISDHFSAGSIDLGYQKLGLYDLREGDIDGILGIDFFMRTIYLDVEAGKAYFGPRGMVIQ